MGKENNSRRKFIKGSAGIIGVCACASAGIGLIQSCENFVQKESPSSGITIEIDVSEYDYLYNKINYGVRLTFEKVNYGIPVIITRLSETEFACFSTLCTHAHCSGEDMRPPLGNFDIFAYMQCNCHGSQFDPYNDGKPVKGPAERPLKQFPTQFDPETNILSIEF
jgi:Rieske Fe-S protein